MPETVEMVITGTNTISAIGYDSEMTSASVRSGISRLEEYEAFCDVGSNPVIAAVIEGISDEKEATKFMAEVSAMCLESLLKKYSEADEKALREIHLLLGVSSKNRPGPRYEGGVAVPLVEKLKNWGDRVFVEIIPTGNASAINGILKAEEILKKDPAALCIIGGIDSLLSEDTLDWFEKAGRLKSETFGRNQSFCPSQAAGFLIVESKKASRQGKKRVMAEIKGVGIAEEPAPFLSDVPSKGEGLTRVVQSTLKRSACRPEDIDAVLCDLDQEIYRSKEWRFAELRLFGNCNGSRQLWHPADCMGNIGAAWGAVLMGIAATGLSCGWMGENLMVFCSDDEGERGAVVLSRNSENI